MLYLIETIYYIQIENIGTITAYDDIQTGSCFSSIYLRRDIKMIPSTMLDFFEWIKGKDKTDIDELNIAFIQWVLMSERNEENCVEAYDHFIDICSSRLNSNPDDLKALKFRSAAFFRTDRFDEGMIDFSRVIELSPQESDIYVERAKYYQRKHKYSEAIADFSKYIAIDSSLPDLFLHRAECYQKNDHYLEAISDYTKALDLGTADNSQCYFYRAQCYSKIDMFDESLHDYNHFINIKPSIDAYFERGTLLSNRDQNQAIADFTESIKMGNDDWNVYLNRGEILKEQKKYDLALRDYNKAIEIWPQNNVAYVYRSELYRDHLKDYEKAISDLKMAIIFNGRVDRRGESWHSVDYDEHELMDEMIDLVQLVVDEKQALNKELDEKRIREDERKKIIADLSHSIKNLISTVIDPLENLKQETSVKPQVIENALRGANLIREIVNAVNLSFKGSINDFRYDAAHNTDSDSQDIKTIITEAFKHSVGNMFDGKYFGTFMRNYFPEKSLYVAGKSEWSTLSQLGDLDRLRPFIEKYFFMTDFDFNQAEQFIIGNQKGSIIKLMILFQEMILNAVKYSAFIDRENRFLKIRFTASEQSVSILVENPFDRETKVKTSGIGHVIIENFAQLLGTTPAIKNDDAIYSVQIRFNNIWKETDK